jgi:hypothetical protein
VRQVVILAALVATGCLSPPAASEGADASAAMDAPGPPGDLDGDGIADEVDLCPRAADVDQADRDADRIGDACDCRPDDGALRLERLVLDDLSMERGTFAPAPSFPAESWSFADGAYRQTRLADGAVDATFVELPPMEDVLIRVTTASTDFTPYPDNLRRQYLVARASSSEIAFSAVVCGLDLHTAVGEVTTRYLSAGVLAGTPMAQVLQDPIFQVDRPVSERDEEIVLEMSLRGPEITCTMISAGAAGVVLTFTQSPFPVGEGRVGFLTQETRASFRGLEVCAYR